MYSVKTYLKSVDRMDVDRIMAWSTMELYVLGIVLRSNPYFRKISLGEVRLRSFQQQSSTFMHLY